MLLTSTMSALLLKAVGRPGYIRHGWTIHEWDIAGNCQRPATRELRSRPLIYVGRSYAFGPGSEKAMSLILHTRCRQCDACRRVKQRMWTARAVAEVRDSARTWFGTLTLRPEEQYRLLSRTRARLASSGVDVDTLPRETQFKEVCSELGKEVTLYLKRVRKESGARLRYIMVAEAHESGMPHLHLLVHEVDANQPVRYATLSTQWKLGFTRFKLALDVKTAAYVCKYIAKAMIARVRASLRYGSDTVEENDLDHRTPKRGPCQQSPLEMPLLQEEKTRQARCEAVLRDCPNWKGKKNHGMVTRSPKGDEWGTCVQTLGEYTTKTGTQTPLQWRTPSTPGERQHAPSGERQRTSPDARPSPGGLACRKSGEPPF